MSGIVTKEHTTMIQKMVREVVNDPATYLGSKYLPSVALPVDKLFVDVVEASGGLTNEHVLDTPAKYIQGFGVRTQEFTIPHYKEAIHYGEKKILQLRKLGERDPSQRGVRQYIDLDMDRLNRRLEARIEKLRWDALMNGGFTFGGLTISFNKPSQNTAVPLGAVWSSDSINPNNSANPIMDIRYWVSGGYAPFRKYKITGLVMNPNTARWILDNTNTKAYISSIGANPNISGWGLQTLMNFVFPEGLKCTIYNGWYQTESIVSGKITVSNAVYMLEDGQILFEVENLPGGDKLGEFVQGIHLAEGTIDQPGYGKFLVVDDNTAPGTKGGPSNPYIDFVAGVYGGPKLDRAFDVLTADVL